MQKEQAGNKRIIYNIQVVESNERKIQGINTTITLPRQRKIENHCTVRGEKATSKSLKIMLIISR